MVEFVSYDGAFPCLCAGILVLRINGKERVMPQYCMKSGGRVWFDKDWGGHVETGPWSVSVPADLADLQYEIDACVNANVPHGCCGGCI